MITNIKVPVTQWGHQANAMICTPDDYVDTPGKAWPTIVFFHGKGEGGTDINKLFGNGLPKLLKAGLKAEAINPFSGIKESFIVVAVQDPGGWSPYPEAMDYAWNFILPKYRIDTNRIIATGLSAGGQTCIMWGTWNSNSHQTISGIISASPANLETRAFANLNTLGKNNVPVWFYSGSNDLTGSFTENAKEYAEIITDNGGKSWVQIFAGGHGPWDALYNGTVKTSWNGKLLNYLEWSLLQKKDTVVTPEPPVEPKKYIQIEHDPEKMNKIIVLDIDGRFTEYDSSNVTIGSTETKAI